MRQVKRRRAAAILAAAGLAVSVQAGDTLKIRLVRADNTGGVDESVKDVVQAMSRNFTFKAYHLQDQATLKLPAAGQVKLGGCTVACNGPQAKLQVNVTRNGEAVIDTATSLVDGKPLIVGGLPSAGGGKLILVFLAQ